MEAGKGEQGLNPAQDKAMRMFMMMTGHATAASPSSSFANSGIAESFLASAGGREDQAVLSAQHDKRYLFFSLKYSMALKTKRA